MTWFLLFIKKIPLQTWFLLGGILLFFVLLSVAYNKGQKNIQDKWDATIAKAKPVIEELETKQNEVTATTITKYVYLTKTIRVKGATIVKEIPIYIPASTPDLPGGFRLLHDAAAASEVPSQADLPGQPVSVRQATETITKNYTTCHLWKAEVDSWNVWYQKQFLVWQTAQRKLQ